MTVSINSIETIAARAGQLQQQMTLAEKIGQMSQVEKDSITPEEVARYAIGSVLSGGGGNPKPNSPEAWAAMVRGFLEAAHETRLRIPLLYGVDAVHGHNNVYGATIFPHNIGLGAAGDPDLVERVARVTARELIATHVHWDFAPCVAVPHDIRWGRTYEGYGEETELVSRLGVAYLRGLQNQAGQRALDHPHTVLASPKHFVGDGGTRWRTAHHYEWMADNWQRPDSSYQIDQGVTEVDEATLRARHLPPYQAAIDAGALNIMISFSSWSGLKMHAHRYLLSDVLKGEMGFSGFLVSDWMAIDQISPDYYQCVVQSINAGLDMVMIPYDYRRFINTLQEAVANGDVSETRIDDAVRRILTAKLALGLFEQPYGDETLLAEVGGAEHRAVAREAVRRSLVLLKNEAVLPLARNIPHLLVAGPAADDLGLQCGGWTVEWLGGRGPIVPGTTLLKALHRSVSPETTLTYSPDGTYDGPRVPVAIVVLSEPPYAEGHGDRADLTLPSDDLALLERVRARCERLLVILYSGRPLIVTDQLPDWDAFVAAWLPGSEGKGLTDVLFGDYPFTGRLSYRWPRHMGQVPVEAGDDPLWPVGFGLTAEGR